MKCKKTAARICALCLSFLLAATVAFPSLPAYADEAENLITSGSFDTDSAGWGVYLESKGDAAISQEDGKLHVSIKDAGQVGHAVQVFYDGFSLTQGVKYKLSFDMSSTVERTMEWRVQINGGDYHAYTGEKDTGVKKDVTSYEFEFTMEEKSDPAPRLCFNLGDEGRSQELKDHDVFIDNVCLVITDSSGAVSGEEESEVNILINQVGYRPADFKRVTFRDASLDKNYTLSDAETGKIVYRGSLTEGESKGSSGEKVSYGDFTDFQTPGTYLIRAKNSGKSYTFTIAEDVYSDLFKQSVKMLYMQRCGIELTEELAGDFAHAACHTELAEDYATGEKFDVSGGWHDAGDYGRYTVPAAKTVADLMLSYERNRDVYGDDTEIPESGNGIADILDETRYELEWMLKMQTKEGGVYHKVSGLNFDETIMPDESTDTLYLLPVSLTATCDFAAAMFMSARVYFSTDKDFAAKCLEAANNALAYAEAHTDLAPYTNPADVFTGEYPDTNAKDELLWAYCEGYKTTQDPALAEKISAFNLKSINAQGLGWMDMSEYAYYAYLTSENISDKTADKFLKILIKEADKAKNCALSDSYGSSIPEDYPWGSNMTIANNGMLMYMAADLTEDDSYKAAAALQLDYLLGSNTTGYCFVSGFGDLGPEHPHHRPSQAIGKTVPGMVAGGPNSNLEDPYAQNVLKNLPKAHCYADSDQSYSCNEIAIYWNSPFIYLLSSVMSQN